MNRTIKLLSFGLVTASGLAVLGIVAWEWQKGLHPYLWTLQPIDEQTADIQCLGVAFLGVHVWEADKWRCAQNVSLKESNQFSSVLDDPNCELTADYRVNCSSPNEALRLVFED